MSEANEPSEHLGEAELLH